MTQQLHDEQVDPWDYPLNVKSDLLSLRAAVRRVHDAEDALDNTMGDCMVPEDVKMALSLAYRRNRAALRAEMAGIDGKKEQKP